VIPPALITKVMAVLVVAVLLCIMQLLNWIATQRTLPTGARSGKDVSVIIRYDCR